MILLYRTSSADADPWEVFLRSGRQCSTISQRDLTLIGVPSPYLALVNPPFSILPDVRTYAVEGANDLDCRPILDHHVDDVRRASTG